MEAWLDDAPVISSWTDFWLRKGKLGELVRTPANNLKDLPLVNMVSNGELNACPSITAQP
jgi:hypothetical protein